MNSQFVIHLMLQQLRKSVNAVLLSVLLLSVIVAILVIPEDGILRNQQTGLISNSPFLKSIVAFIFIFFSLAGVVYGYTAGTIKIAKILLMP